MEGTDRERGREGRRESNKMVRTTNGRWNESEETYGLRKARRRREDEEGKEGGKKVGKEEGKTN